MKTSVCQAEGGFSRRKLLLISACLIALALLLVWALRGTTPATGAVGSGTLPLRPDLSPSTHVTANVDGISMTQALAIYAELTGYVRENGSWKESLDDFAGGRLRRWHVISLPARRSAAVIFHADGRWTAQELKETIESLFRTNGIAIVPGGKHHFRVVKTEQR